MQKRSFEAVTRSEPTAKRMRIEDKNKTNTSEEKSDSIQSSQQERINIFSRIQQLTSQRQQLIKQLHAPRPQQPVKQDSKEGKTENRVNNLKSQLSKIEQEFKQLEQSGEVKKVSPEVSNMVHEHSLSISKFAMGNGVIVIWRPINPEAAAKLGDPTAPYQGKGMNIKAKSSYFGPIAGDIPSDPGLSKEAGKPLKDLKESRIKNEHVIAEAKKTFEEIQSLGITHDNYKEINDRLIICEVTKKVKVKEQEYDVYYMLGENGEVLWNETSSCPRFLIKVQGEHKTSTTSSESSTPPEVKWLEYQEELEPKGFSVPVDKPKKEPQPVKIMGYHHYTIEDSKPVDRPRPVTADYDELVSAPRKIFPFSQNSRVPTEFVFSDFKALSNLRTLGKTCDPADVAAMNLGNFELKEKQEHRDRRFYSSMGNVNPLELTAKVHMKFETAGATNHGPEVNNPFPEKFEKEGKYAVHLPDGSVTLLHNEKDICRFINAMRKDGFPLDVNPKWGWDIHEETRELFVPDDDPRFDWREVSTKLAEESYSLTNIRKELSILENDHNRKILQEAGKKIIDATLPDDKSSPKLPQVKLKSNWYERLQRGVDANPFQSRDTERLGALARGEHQMERDQRIIELQVAIQKFRLEPDIVYSPYIDNNGSIPQESTIDSAFREEVVKKVKNMDMAHRQIEINEHQGCLKKLKEEYRSRFESSCIVDLYEEEWRKKLASKQLKSEDLSSSTSPFSNRLSLSSYSWKPRDREFPMSSPDSPHFSIFHHDTSGGVEDLTVSTSSSFSSTSGGSLYASSSSSSYSSSSDTSLTFMNI